ncbi:MAG: tRNA pseudouridine55 synthase [Francisellaceae bacterium]|jgi:tRNA pseudouridine55 synthase
MGRRKGDDIDGIILLDKPYGLSSNQALQKVRWLFNAKKAGHTGSLDPMATGLLPICFGRSTKICQYLLNSDKAYIAIMQLGVSTTTGDKEGDELEVKSVPDIDEKKLNSIVENFSGKLTQVPPMYSALKHKGKPLYEYARAGIVIPREEREIIIHKLDILDFDAELSQLKIYVSCSKGTYIRTLSEDIGKMLGVPAHLVYLHRVQCGIFKEEQMKTLKNLTVISEASNKYAAILEVETAFLDAEIVKLNNEEYRLFRDTGKWMNVALGLNGVKRLYLDGLFKGIAEFNQGAVIKKQWFDTTE